MPASCDILKYRKDEMQNQMRGRVDGLVQGKIRRKVNGENRIPMTLHFLSPCMHAQPCVFIFPTLERRDQRDLNEVGGGAMPDNEEDGAMATEIICSDWQAGWYKAFIDHSTQPNKLASIIAENSYKNTRKRPLALAGIIC
jgi:hypothetical protein